MKFIWEQMAFPYQSLLLTRLLLNWKRGRQPSSWKGCVSCGTLTSSWPCLPSSIPPKYTLLMVYVGILSLFVLQAGTLPSIQSSAVSVRNERLTHWSGPTMSISGQVRNTASRHDLALLTTLKPLRAFPWSRCPSSSSLASLWGGNPLEQPAVLCANIHSSLFSH